MEKKNLKNALKVIFRGTILGVFFFYFFSSPGGGARGGFDKCQTFFFEGFPNTDIFSVVFGCSIT